MTIKFANNASAQLASSITSTATSLDVAAGSGALFPSLTGSDYFMADLVSSTAREIVKVTARSTDTFTIVRGQEGTTAVAFAAGDRIENRITAATLDAIAQLDSPTFTGTVTVPTPTLGTDAANKDYVDTAVAGGGGGGGGSAPAWTLDSPDAAPGVPDPADDEFGGSDYTGETALDTGGTRFSGATPWAWRNQGTATATLSNGVLLLKALGASGSFPHRIVEQSTPAGTAWRFRAKISGGYLDNYTAAGMVLADSSSGKIITLAREGQGASYRLGVLEWTDPNTFGGNLATLSPCPTGSIIYYEIERSGSNLYFRWSDSGFDGSFVTFATTTLSAYLTALDKIGVFAVSNTTGVDVTAVVEWFRRMA